MGAILIVEDDAVIRDGLVKIVQEIDHELIIYQTGSAKEALSIAKRNSVNIFFLDIQLEDYSGFELAKQIRGVDIYNLTPIVFITGVHSKELDAYRNVHCYSFIYKPFIESDIKQVLKKIQNGLNNQKPKTIKLKEKEFTYIINQEEIIYIESKNRKILVKTIYEDAYFTSFSLSKLAEQLSIQFIQCHKSYLINSAFVYKIDRNNSYISLINVDTLIPIGRKYKDEIWRLTL